MQIISGPLLLLGTGQIGPEKLFILPQPGDLIQFRICILHEMKKLQHQQDVCRQQEQTEKKNLYSAQANVRMRIQINEKRNEQNVCGNVETDPQDQVAALHEASPLIFMLIAFRNDSECGTQVPSSRVTPLRETVVM